MAVIGGAILLSAVWGAAEHLQMEREKAGMGGRAAETAAAIFDAQHQCLRIMRINELDACLAFDAKLPKEVTAAEQARSALGLRDAFYERCQKFNSTDECTTLLLRGWYIRQREVLDKTK
ncbi:hypothetical protein [Ramlibacter alkalitolerans]|uniref:Lysozyme inhibitor LprI N-terminal domain-containing protein n=1 Tax=Ramlibacter alkalitolerans TaxID=2039631 RepID=A0ABS1JVU3_9BURK|nr:hypothetical protein [Ramlibacter alkalitolerans]MBL0427665.1 hypothetical protein [Ramlibacter alkalitolerans]